MEVTSINKTRRITETAIMIALATVLSYVVFSKLPMGGSVTLFSQVPIIIIGYRYGLKWGAATGVIHGLLQMVLQGLENFSYVKGIGSYLILIFADYVVAFMVLGIGGALFKKAVKNQALALGLGAAVASVLRYLCHFVSGATIWKEYAGDQAVWFYSLTYNATYMLPELIISVIGVVLLAVVLDFNSPTLIRKKKA
ncbi:MAG: energy-coupled thiamine transporter ThiT [Eubacterium sp.]|uniref:energy-coupled thiamine transporter ThiT n=1 Tax=Eubacterium sp. TaxID=142586 RepID=UPI003A3C81EB